MNGFHELFVVRVKFQNSTLCTTIKYIEYITRKNEEWESCSCFCISSMDTYNTSRVLPACFAFYFFLLPTSAPSPLEYEFLFYHFRAWYFTERFYGVFYDKHDGKSFSKKKKKNEKGKMESYGNEFRRLR